MASRATLELDRLVDEERAVDRVDDRGPLVADHRVGRSRRRRGTGAPSGTSGPVTIDTGIPRRVQRAIAARVRGAELAAAVDERAVEVAGERRDARGESVGEDQPPVDSTTYCGDVRDLLRLELVAELRHPALAERDPL